MNNPETTQNKVEIQRVSNPEIRIGSVEDGGDLISLTILMRMAEVNGTEILDEEISEAKISSDFVNKFSSFLEGNSDEALEWVAFSYERSSEDRQLIIDQLVRYKNMTVEEAQNLFENFGSFLNEFKKENQSIIKLVELESANDIKIKQESLEVLNTDIENAINFFLPTIGAKEIILLPSSPISSRESGSAILMDEKLYIYSSQLKTGGVNRRNIIHEYLHTVINPITDKIDLDSIEKERIDALSSEKLINQEYSDYSMLNESLIRNYGMGAGEVDGEWAFTEDKLGERIMKLYKQYIEVRGKESDLSFEDYFLDNYGALFA